MILLELENKIVSDTLTYKFENAGKPTSIDVTVADFDGVLYKIYNPDGEKSHIAVAISLKFFSDLQKYGADEYLMKEYGDYYFSPPEGFDFAVIFKLDNLPTDYSAIVKQVSLLKRNCFASVFQKMFDAQSVGGNERAVINYRDDETLYIDAKEDRVTVIFGTVFKDEDDVIYGKVFMQEFKEGRKASQTAPQVLFSHCDPPRESKVIPL